MSANDCLLAVDAGGTFLKAVLMTPQQQSLPDSFLRIPVASQGSAGEIATAYRRLSAAAAGQAAAQGRTIVAAGVCIPGPFDYPNGVSLMQHKYAAIYNQPLCPWLQSSLPGLPVAFLHDANSFLLGCLREEPLRDCRRIAGVTLGTGLGFATYWDGSLNHNPLGGPAISIYAQPFRDGTAEDYVSRRAILHDYAQLTGQQDSTLDVADLAALALRDSASPAAMVFDRMGTALGQLLVPVAHQHGLEGIVFGGAICKSWELFAPALQRELAAVGGLNAAFVASQIDLAPLQGAAAFALQQQNLQIV